ncbi:MAG: FGGY family carbohydrate kinase [Planctomycetota bacterium]
MAYLIGFDAGSSSIKGTLLDTETGRPVAAHTSPETELVIDAPHPGWAEQDPDDWWRHLCVVSQALTSDVDPADVAAVGIAYQMHGLVLVDDALRPLRPAIIWCDGRTQPLADRAADELGSGFLEHALNLPGNFTASKLAWVKQNEPDVYAAADKAMLPGDYLAACLSGQVCTTPSGLSEGVLWDFVEGARLDAIVDYYGLGERLLPDVRPTFSVQGAVSAAAAEATGLREGTPIAYRAGDQPNNALSLGVLEPGQVATTAGTSGVIYAVTDDARYDPASRVNVFVHVNHEPGRAHRYGVLACINGTGALYRWLRGALGADYPALNELAGSVAPGADGVTVIPYGNGPERTQLGRNTGMSVHGVDLNRHRPGHLARAAQEGIVFALKQGTDVMAGMGVDVRAVRAGRSNMFLSDLFGSIYASAIGAEVELMETDGSQGAARGAGIGAGLYERPADAFAGLEPVRVIEPDDELRRAYADLYPRWCKVLETTLA